MNLAMVRNTLLALFLSLAPAGAQQRFKPYDGTKVVIQTTAVKRDGTIVIVANVPSKDEIEAVAFECAKQHAITCVGPKFGVLGFCEHPAITRGACMNPLFLVIPTR